jgi:hypothetical protein
MVRDAREAGVVLDGRLDQRLADRVVEAAVDAAPGEQVRDAVAKVVEIAEMDPEGTRTALWALRGNASALDRLEAGLGLSPKRATLALGGAIQLASAELASAEPDLAGRVPELVRWLEGTW